MSPAHEAVRLRAIHLWVMQEAKTVKQEEEEAKLIECLPGFYKIEELDEGDIEGKVRNSRNSRYQCLRPRDV